MINMRRTEEYRRIKSYYGKSKAARSGLPMINHINEGLVLLHMWGASELAQKAFCIHPLIQNEMALPVFAGAKPIHLDVIKLAEEYADRANSYLCKPDTDWVKNFFDIECCVPSMSYDCVMMLLADKVQNQKDFRIYHWFTHDRSDELEQYFNLWIRYLRILKQRIEDGGNAQTEGCSLA